MRGYLFKKYFRIKLHDDRSILAIMGSRGGPGKGHLCNDVEIRPNDIQVDKNLRFTVLSNFIYII